MPDYKFTCEATLQVHLTHHNHCKCYIFQGDGHETIHFCEAVVLSLFFMLNVLDIDSSCPV